jgi:hypothetical protein
MHSKHRHVEASGQFRAPAVFPQRKVFQYLLHRRLVWSKSSTGRGIEVKIVGIEPRSSSYCLSYPVSLNNNNNNPLEPQEL